MATMSVGVTLAGPPEFIAAIINRADQAQHQAKRAGRDQVMPDAEPPAGHH